MVLRTRGTTLPLVLIGNNDETTTVTGSKEAAATTTTGLDYSHRSTGSANTGCNNNTNAYHNNTTTTNSTLIRRNCYYMKEILISLLLLSVLLNIMFVIQLHSMDTMNITSTSSSSNTNSITLQQQQHSHQVMKHLLSQQQQQQQSLQQVQNNNNNNDASSSSSSSTSTKTTALQCTLNYRYNNYKYDPQVLEDMTYWRTDKEILSSSSSTIMEFPTLYNHHPNTAKQQQQDQYIIFEPDSAGFNNVRLSLETIIAITKSMNRILVVPPKHSITQLITPQVPYHLINDFFHITNLPMISMEDYLQRMMLSSQLHTNNNNNHNSIVFPPQKNRTNWDQSVNTIIGQQPDEYTTLYTNYLMKSTYNIDWKRDTCIIVFPNTSIHSNHYPLLDQMMDHILQSDMNHNPQQRVNSYVNHPPPSYHLQTNIQSIITNQTAEKIILYQRLHEMMADRKQLCYYNETLQNIPSLYITSSEKSGIRPLLPFYSYLFYTTIQQELSMKLYIRDHMRYNDIIHCAAARIVQEIRTIAKSNNHDEDNTFDTMHVRRGDFQKVAVYKDGLDEMQEIIKAHYFTINRTIYIATDESDTSFFHTLQQYYHIVYLKDFIYLLSDIDPNYYGMIEQLICAQGTKFVGTYYSTFSAYINRLRGYHEQKRQRQRRQKQQQQTVEWDGSINSEYMGHKGYFRNVMKKYMSIQGQGQLWTREWPTAWRNIDFD